MYVSSEAIACPHGTILTHGVVDFYSKVYLLLVRVSCAVFVITAKAEPLFISSLAASQFSHQVQS